MNTGNPYVLESVVEKTDTVQIVKVTKLAGKRVNGNLVRIAGKVVKVPVSHTYKLVNIKDGGESEVLATLGEARKEAGIDYNPPASETRPASDYAEQQKGYHGPSGK